MIPIPPMSALLDSALAKLAASFIPEDEFVSPSIKGKIAMLCEAIERASPAKRMESSDILTQILKTLDTQDAITIFSRIVRSDMVLMDKISSDPLIQQKLRHIYRVAEIASIVSRSNLRAVKDGIGGVRKKIFEVSTQ